MSSYKRVYSNRSVTNCKLLEQYVVLCVLGVYLIILSTWASAYIPGNQVRKIFAGFICLFSGVELGLVKNNACNVTRKQRQ